MKKPYASLPINQRAYAHTISIHCPGIDETEMQARCELARIRDEAGVGLQRGSPHLAGMLSDVARLAAAAVYAPMPTSKLIRTKGALQLALDSARMLEIALRSA